MAVKGVETVEVVTEAVRVAARAAATVAVRVAVTVAATVAVTVAAREAAATAAARVASRAVVARWEGSLLQGSGAVATAAVAWAVAAARAVVEAFQVEGEVRGRAGMVESLEAAAMDNGIRRPKPVRPLECWPRGRCPTDPIATESSRWSRWSWRCCACRSGC